MAAPSSDNVVDASPIPSLSPEGWRALGSIDAIASLSWEESPGALAKARAEGKPKPDPDHGGRLRVRTAWRPPEQVSGGWEVRGVSPGLLASSDAEAAENDADADGKGGRPPEPPPTPGVAPATMLSAASIGVAAPSPGLSSSGPPDSVSGPPVIEGRWAEADDLSLVEVIGRGGQGEVWRAWQGSLSREVAVKCLIAENPREFLHEAYTTAALDHPNIAPVHDLAHADDSGNRRRAMVMKLIQGRSWSDSIWYDRRATSFDRDAYLRRHLKILIEVCNAVAFAHSRGIIHRDLKPAQVMVGDFGEVYLMDWGMALSIREDVPRSPKDGLPKFRTLSTARNLCGTPAYMAPEQTDEKVDRLGFHTDIYLLGAILHHLVTGNPPHNATYASRALLRALENHVDPLPADCPPELRAILGKAMATDPAARHRSATVFRDALDAYLSGASNKAESVRISSEVGEAFLVGTRGDLDYMTLAKLQHALQRALQVWPGNRRANDLLQQIHVYFAEAALRARDYLLAQSLAAWLPEDHAERSGLLKRIAGSRDRLERLSRGQTAARLVAWISLAALLIVTTSSLWNEKRSRARLQDSMETAQRSEQRTAVAHERARAGRDGAQALAGFMLSDLSGRLTRIGRSDLLESVAEQALAYFDHIGDDGSTTALRLRALASRQRGEVAVGRGFLPEGRADYERALETLRRLHAAEPSNTTIHADLATQLERLAWLAWIEEDFPAARRMVAEALRTRESLAAEHEDDDSLMEELAKNRQLAGDIEWLAGDLPASIRARREALDLARRMARAHPASAAAAERVALGHAAMGFIMLEFGEPEQAVREYTEALDILRPESESQPDSVVLQGLLAQVTSGYGIALARSGETRLAEETLRDSIALHRRVTQLDQSNVSRLYYYSTALQQLALLLVDSGRQEEGLEFAQRARSMRAGMVDRAPSVLLVRERLAESLRTEGVALRALGRTREAVASWDQAIAIGRELVAISAANHVRVFGLCDALADSAEVLAARGDATDATVRVDEAVRLLEAAATSTDARTERGAREMLEARFLPLREKLGASTPGAPAPAGNATPAP